MAVYNQFTYVNARSKAGFKPDGAKELFDPANGATKPVMRSRERKIIPIAVFAGISNLRFGI
jgi:hypothetical protein